jgi:hypothetical protein
MSERSEIAVVLILALFIGAFIDRITALKMVAGMALLWVFENQPAVFEGIRKLFLQVRGEPSVREYRGDLRKNRKAA